jgi:hypothetical protein
VHFKINTLDGNKNFNRFEISPLFVFHEFEKKKYISIFSNKYITDQMSDTDKETSLAQPDMMQLEEETSQRLGSGGDTVTPLTAARILNEVKERGRRFSRTKPFVTIGQRRI